MREKGEVIIRKGERDGTKKVRREERGMRNNMSQMEHYS